MRYSLKQREKKNTDIAILSKAESYNVNQMLTNGNISLMCEQCAQHREGTHCRKT